MSSTAARRWADWLPPTSRPVDLMPIYPVVNFAPGSPCPHRGPIRDESSAYCEQCARVSRDRQRAIDLDRSAPPPEDPEVRIARWQRLFASGRITTEQRLVYQAYIDEILSLVERESRPTRYAPDRRLKGGLGPEKQAGRDRPR